MKKILTIILVCLISVIPSSCEKKPLYEKYQADFIGAFDTITYIIGYAKSEDDFTKFSQAIYNRLFELHRYYDIYNDYEGINNLKTINDNAGKQPVEVSKEIIDLLKLAVECYDVTGGSVNVCFGSVLSVWHDFRTAGINDSETAELPPMEKLRELSDYTDINDLVIDEAASTVYLKKPEMSLDVGAMAKGYATKLALDAGVASGMESAILDVGGNVIAVGKPLDGARDRWGIGVQDPQKSVDGVNNLIDTIYLNDSAVVTSGNYQRYYVVDDKMYNHIIDPQTLMPAERYSAVSVIYSDSGIADVLSTALFILPKDEGKALLNKYGAEAIWIGFENELEATDGYIAISKTLGNYSAVDKK